MAFLISKLSTIRNLFFFAVFILAVGSGCGLYSFSGSLPPHLKTVAVPLFDNRTAEFAIAEDITDAIIKEFNKDNSLKIADRNAADVLIEGSVISLDDRAGAFDPNEEVKDFKVYVTVQVKCTDQVKRLTMWEERVTQWGEYDPNAGPDARKDGITAAITKMSQEVLNKTVAAW
jgi:hypothetical protein